jgi:hypothetical protein
MSTVLSHIKPSGIPLSVTSPRPSVITSDGGSESGSVLAAIQNAKARAQAAHIEADNGRNGGLKV